MADFLADRILAEADIADRPGQGCRLEAIAEEVRTLTEERDSWHRLWSALYEQDDTYWQERATTAEAALVALAKKHGRGYVNSYIVDAAARTESGQRQGMIRGLWPKKAGEDTVDLAARTEGQ